MSVKVRRRNGAWWVFVCHQGRRKAKKVGTREAAERVRREIEAQVALGDFGLFAEGKPQMPTFGDYAARWQKEHVDVHCKRSSAVKHDQVLRLYLLPRLSRKRLDEIHRVDLKGLLADLIEGRKPDRSTSADTDILRQYYRRVAAGTFNQAAAQADVKVGKLKPQELQTLLR
jgi:hypothetical protein